MTILSLPDWPAAMKREMAALYVSEHETHLPAPSYGDGRKARWLRADLDKWLAEKAGYAPQSPMDWEGAFGNGDHAA